MQTVRADLLIDRLWPRRTGASEFRRQLVLVLIGTLILTISAKFKMPFWPVPMTLQTAAVFLVGIFYGPRLGALTVFAYLAEGALGLPVFAGTPERGIGLAYMLGPTGGYLAAFPLAAAMTGLAAERGVRWPGMAVTIALATAFIYLAGATWLATFVGVDQALALGVVPFLLGDLVKLLLVTAIFELGRGRIGNRGG